MKDLYTSKNQEYYANVRKDIVSVLPINANKILEIGAGGGYTLDFIKRNNTSVEVTGIELFDMPHTLQKSETIDRFIIADVEKDLETLDLAKEYFDTIICGDVLEHLTDPWKVIDVLSSYLKTDGTIIISVPNIREITVLFKIFFQGDFRYNAQGGILDKTHLRFFCKKNALEMLSTDRLMISKYYSNIDLVKMSAKKKIFNWLTLGLFKDFLTVQHIVIAKKYK